jgi:hypothetical protein
MNGQFMCCGFSGGFAVRQQPNIIFSDNCNWMSIFETGEVVVNWQAVELPMDSEGLCISPRILAASAVLWFFILHWSSACSLVRPWGRAASL